MPGARKLLMIGLDCAAPELVFDRWRGDLPNLRGLIDDGVWGPLESAIPPITVPAWMTGMTSKDPGQLGIYGFRNRSDHSYDGLTIANSTSVHHDTVWDILGRLGKQTITVAVPPAYPPRPIQGATVGCFLTPGTDRPYTYPTELGDEIRDLVGEYLVDVPNFRTDDKEYILRQCQMMTERRFAVIRHLAKTRPWDLLAFVEIGVDRMHHGFWKDFDETHPKHVPGGPYQNAIFDYYKMVDHEIGELLRLVPEDTVVMVASDHGAKKMVGGLCVNEWLIREGYLTLRSNPETVTPFAKLEIDWDKTLAWGDGGYYGRIFMNVQGREPSGRIPAAEYERARDELADAITAISDDKGAPMGTRVFKPEDIYREARNVPPDLLVYFGDLDWRSVGSVGHQSIYTFENDIGPDDANHSQQGIFILRDGERAGGPVDGLKLLDLGPNILEHFGVPVPADMLGQPLSRRLPR